MNIDPLERAIAFLMWKRHRSFSQGGARILGSRSKGDRRSK
ncbi:MAG: hypothetical protein V7K50_04060 [Nostoc sp.]